MSKNPRPPWTNELQPLPFTTLKMRKVQLRLLPRSILYGIGTAIMSAIFAWLALPPLEKVAEVHPAVAAVSNVFRIAIAFMPLPNGLIVFGYYLYQEHRAARHDNDQ